VLRTDDVVDILEYLVDQNPAMFSSRDQDGLLPLHVACRRGSSFSIVQSLVKSVTFQGDLSLFLACDVLEPSPLVVFGSDFTDLTKVVITVYSNGYQVALDDLSIFF
jgi:ankyrin repeat protein